MNRFSPVAAALVLVLAGGCQLPMTSQMNSASDKNSAAYVVPPSTPSGISLVSGDSQVTVTWKPISNATSYNLYYSGGAAAASVKVSNVTSPYTLTGLVDGKTYNFTLTAVNAGGESVASASTGALPQAPVPGAPTGVSAAAANSQVTLSWTNVSGATSYNLYYLTSSGVTASTGNRVTAVTNPYTLPNLTNGTAYYFIVTAISAAGEAASNQVSATPDNTPSGVVAVADIGQAYLSWTAVTGATSYNLSYSTSASMASATKLTGVSSGSAVTGLTNWTTYYFTVSTVSASGESAQSAAVSAQPYNEVALVNNYSGGTTSGSIDSNVIHFANWTYVRTTWSPVEPQVNSIAVSADHKSIFTASNSGKTGIDSTTHPQYGVGMISGFSNTTGLITCSSELPSNQFVGADGLVSVTTPTGSNLICVGTYGNPGVGDIYDNGNGGLSTPVAMSYADNTTANRMVAADLNGKFLYSADINGNVVHAFTITPDSVSNGDLTLVGTVTSDAGPYRMTVAKVGTNEYLYVCCNSGACIDVFQINTSTGALTKMGTIPTGSGTAPNSVAVNAAGTFLYVACTTGDKVEMFPLSQTTALNSAAATSNTVANGAISVALDYTGTCAAVTSNNFCYVYSVNQTTGALSTSPVLSIPAGTSPSQVLFVKLQ